MIFIRLFKIKCEKGDRNPSLHPTCVLKCFPANCKLSFKAIIIQFKTEIFSSFYFRWLIAVQCVSENNGLGLFIFKSDRCGKKNNNRFLFWAGAVQAGYQTVSVIPGGQGLTPHTHRCAGASSGVFVMFIFLVKTSVDNYPVPRLLAAVLPLDYGKVFYTWPFAYISIIVLLKKVRFCFAVLQISSSIARFKLQFTCWHDGSYQTLTGLVHTRGLRNTFYLFPRCWSHIPPRWPIACMQTQCSTKGPVYLFIKVLCINICRTASPSIE